MAVTNNTFNCMSKSEGLGSELSCVNGGNTDTSEAVGAKESGDSDADGVVSDEDAK